MAGKKLFGNFDLSTNKYQLAMALREHLLAGHRVSLLEAMLLFGVQNPNAELTRIRKDGFLVKSQRVPMAKIIRRINEYTLCKVPEGLPHREIQLTEYWVSN
jgi:hypothetical protein